jgi:hypothetical protein
LGRSLGAIPWNRKFGRTNRFKDAEMLKSHKLRKGAESEELATNRGFVIPHAAEDAFF